MEKWILDRLNVAAEEVNKQMAERNFFMTTNAVYNFWLYELCDVYIVSRVRIDARRSSPNRRKR